MEKLARPGEITNCVSGTMDEAKVGGASALEKGRDIVPPWDSLPSEALENFLQRLDFEDLFRCKAVCKTFKAIIESDGFLESRGDGREGFFTAISYFLNNNAWRWCGFDVESNSWRSLPTFSSCPLRPDRFSKSSVSGHRSLMCGHVSEGRLKGKVVVFNPLTGRTRVLPPLLHSRIPVMVHFSVDSGGDSYTVVAAGSTSKNNWHNLQGKVEVFCSTTSKWTEASEVPESTFKLRDQQTGVSINGILYCIASSRYSHIDKGVVAFDVKNGTWMPYFIRIPATDTSSSLQLVECNGRLHRFSEREHFSSVERRIDVLDCATTATGDNMECWTNVISVQTDLEVCQVQPFVYSLLPMFSVLPKTTTVPPADCACVSFGEGKLCVFSTVRREGVAYNMLDGSEVAELPPANHKGVDLVTFNRPTFALQPSFAGDRLL